MPEHLRALGFDYGTKKIGIAVGQSAGGATSALDTVSQADFWRRLDELVQEWQPDCFVVGWPTHLNDDPHELWPPIEKFCDRLLRHGQLPVHKHPEYLTSHEAEHLKRQTRSEQSVDAIAAQLILESWLQSGAI